MKFDDNLPIYVQIMDLLKSQISSGRLDMGEKLPSVRDMSKKLKVNPNTIQRSYQELEREEIVFTQRGMGTFVTKDLELIDGLKDKMAKELVLSFIKDMEALAFSGIEIVRMVEEYLNKEGEENEHS